jgi:indolepyruvate ferredoxin oxidoreductase
LRLLQDKRCQNPQTFDGDIKTITLPRRCCQRGWMAVDEAAPLVAGMGRMFPWLAKLRCCAARQLDPFGYTFERRMERALITAYRRDMAALGTNAAQNLCCCRAGRLAADDPRGSGL